MSDVNQSGASGGPSAGPEAVLRFSCTNCGKELTAPSSAAGVEAPCPICGVTIRAPLSPAADPPEWSSPAEAVAPAPAPQDAPPPDPADAQQEETLRYRAAPAPPTAPADPGSPLPRERRERRRERRSIDPSTAFSSTYEESKEVGALVRIFLAILCTAAVTIGVFFFVQKKINEPPPEPEPEFSLTR